MPRVGWQDVYLSAAPTRFYKAIKEYPLEGTVLTQVQNDLKNQVRLSFKELAKKTYPILKTIACGSILIHIQSPPTFTTNILQEQVYVYEDMVTHRHAYKVLVKGEKILSTHIMTIPIPTNPAELFVQTHEGIPGNFPLTFPIHLKNYPRMTTLLAVEEYIYIYLTFTEMSGIYYNI
jgi:hypothetical protein